MTTRFDYTTALAQLTRSSNPISRLSAMVGAFNFLHSADSVMFRFRGCRRANYCKVTLAADDTYTISFHKVGKLNSKDVATFDGIYADGLMPAFEKTTGLYLSL